MSEETVDFDIEIENLDEVKNVFKQFSREMVFRLFDSFGLTANREEKILKSTIGFRDRTGRLRRDLFVTAVLNPLGIEMGTHTPYAGYVAFGHGTWRGGFWDEYIMGAVPRILDSIDRVVRRLTKEYSTEESE